MVEEAEGAEEERVEEGVNDTGAVGWMAKGEVVEGNEGDGEGVEEGLGEEVKDEV